MIIKLSPQVKTNFIPLSLAKLGDVLSINGTPVDFSVIPEGADLPSSAVDNDFITGTYVSRINGKIHVTILLPIPLYETSQAICFPADIVDPLDGPIPLPTDGVI